MKFVVLTCLVAVASAGILPLPYHDGENPDLPISTGGSTSNRKDLKIAPEQSSILGKSGTLDKGLDHSTHEALDKSHNLRKRAVYYPVLGNAINRVATPLVVPSVSFAARYNAARSAPVENEAYVETL